MTLPWLLVLLLAALLVLALLAWGWERGRAGRASRARNRLAQAGEDDADELLAAAGFRVVDRQVEGGWSLWVDEVEVWVRCRADRLVERDGERFVAEVKTGAYAPDPTFPATRRQLLEYRIAFPVDGVLLVDMDAGCIREVRLPIED